MAYETQQCKNSCSNNNYLSETLDQSCGRNYNPNNGNIGIGYTPNSSYELPAYNPECVPQQNLSCSNASQCCSNQCLNPNSNQVLIQRVYDSQCATGSPITDATFTTATGFTAAIQTSPQTNGCCNCCPSGTACTITTTSTFTVTSTNVYVLSVIPASFTGSTINGDTLTPVLQDNGSFYVAPLNATTIAPVPWSLTCPTCNPASVLLTAVGAFTVQLAIQVCGTVTTDGATCNFIATFTPTATTAVGAGTTSTAFANNLCIPAPCNGFYPYLGITLNYTGQIVTPVITAATGTPVLTGTLFLIPQICVDVNLPQKAIAKFKYIYGCIERPEVENQYCCNNNPASGSFGTQNTCCNSCNSCNSCNGCCNNSCSCQS